MKTYNVTVPIAGHVHVQVDAEDEESAEQEAYEAASEFLGGCTFPDTAHASLEEVNAYEHIIQGNVCYVDHTQIEVEEG